MSPTEAKPVILLALTQLSLGRPAPQQSLPPFRWADSVYLTSHRATGDIRCECERSVVLSMEL